MKSRLIQNSIEKRLILLILILNFIVIPKIQGKNEVRNLLKYVDQNLTVRTGYCTFGVSMPLDSIRPCPHTSSVGSRSYVATDKIVGFTNVNMGSHYKYINLLVSPQIGLDCWNDNKGSTAHDSEKANEFCQPDYYSVDLTKFGIKTEITPSNFSAIYRFTYPEAKDGMASMVIYPSFWADCTYSTVNFDSTENIISGYWVSNDGWYYTRPTIYYAIQLGKPLISHGMFNNKEKRLYEKFDTISGEEVGGYLKFKTLKDEKVFMKVSISTKSVENAKKFLSDEILKWNFDKVRTNAEKTWNKTLNSILKVAQVFTRNNDYLGDEDSDAMSSWFVFSGLGFFSVAGQDVYLINEPGYKKVTIPMENGKKIVINGNGASFKNQYIKSATLNGKKLTQTWIKHSELKNGATIDFNMGETPYNWGSKGKLPPSFSDGKMLVINNWILSVELYKRLLLS